MVTPKKSKSRPARNPIVQIAGPGGIVPELEHCPTIFHVDFSQAEFDSFLANPSAITKSLGLGSSPPAFVLLNGFLRKTKAKPRWCGHRTDDNGWIFYIH